MFVGGGKASKENSIAIDPGSSYVRFSNRPFWVKRFQAIAPLLMRNTVSDLQDWTDYYDRGLAKLLSGFPYDAISDFTDAIKIEGRELLKSSAYEGRANAYMQTREWALAIADLTTAISLQTGGSVLVQFRAIYPEYGVVSDEAIAQKLNYEDFAAHFLTGRPLSSRAIWNFISNGQTPILKKEICAVP